jgi:pimeloyl-ACP methyl ester carboxylesterase
MPSSASSSTTSSSTRSASPVGADRPTIVFLHGTRLTGAQWAVQVSKLGDEFDCRALDLPGHGVAAAIPFTVDGAAELVARTIEREAHGGRAILVGLSLGGFVAMVVAARWPERVSGLVVSGASGDPVGLRSVGYRALGAIFRLVPVRVLDATNRWYFARRYPAVAAEPILAGGFWFRGGAVAVRSLVGQRFRERLARYPGPVLIVNGQFDLFFRPTERAFAESAANARRVIIRRATHLTNLDQPEAFTATVRRFAREVTASADARGSGTGGAGGAGRTTSAG